MRSQNKKMEKIIACMEENVGTKLEKKNNIERMCGRCSETRLEEFVVEELIGVDNILV